MRGMFWRQGRRILFWLALVSIPACVYCPRPSGSFAVPPLPTSQSVASARLPAPAAMRASAERQAIIDALKSAPPLPAAWSPPPIVILPTGPAIEIESVEPIDPPIQAASAITRGGESAPVPAPEGNAANARSGSDWLGTFVPLAARLADMNLAKADPQDLAAIVEQINTALTPVRAHAALDIPKLCFCRPVAAPARFGAYERLDENHRFHPGETVAVYMELRNFACQPTDSTYTTHIKSTVELRDAEGKMVFHFDCDRADASLSPRLDYCHVGRFTLPKLPPGSYTLWLKATDVPTGRSARRSLDFRIGSATG